jgi:hypothetical protein
VRLAQEAVTFRHIHLADKSAYAALVGKRVPPIEEALRELGATDAQLDVFAAGMREGADAHFQAATAEVERLIS